MRYIHTLENWPHSTWDQEKLSMIPPLHIIVKTQKNSLDITPWLEWSLHCLNAASVGKACLTGS